MICEAEARQVEEYKRERTRIEDEHGKLRGQIEQLKTALEHAQVIRRRKIEYDTVTEKVNTLPTREELEQSIMSLENDMVAIRSEHDTQNRRIQAQKIALDGVISDLGAVNMMGKDKETTSQLTSPVATPAMESEGFDTTLDNRTGSYSGDSLLELEEAGEVEKEIGEDRDSEAVLLSTSSSLNAAAQSFLPLQPLTKGLEDDIEMGEVAEDPKVIKGKKKVRDEELEEGEASDSSSALSDLPSD
jgi:THO complex subunit 7